MTPVLLSLSHSLSLLTSLLCQVLILSYEMFLRHSLALNATPLLDIIVCDEAHRLKNVTGTKTISALRSGQPFPVCHNLSIARARPPSDLS
jgi:hypothetical protein